MYTLPRFNKDGTSTLGSEASVDCLLLARWASAKNSQGLSLVIFKTEISLKKKILKIK